MIKSFMREYCSRSSTRFSSSVIFVSFSMFCILSVWISPIRSMIFVCCAEIFATSADKKSSNLLISSASSGWLAVFFGGILSSVKSYSSLHRMASFETSNGCSIIIPCRCHHQNRNQSREVFKYGAGAEVGAASAIPVHSAAVHTQRMIVVWKRSDKSVKTAAAPPRLRS